MGYSPLEPWIFLFPSVNQASPHLSCHKIIKLLFVRMCLKHSESLTGRLGCSHWKSFYSPSEKQKESKLSVRWFRSPGSAPRGIFPLEVLQFHGIRGLSHTLKIYNKPFLWALCCCHILMKCSFVWQEWNGEDNFGCWRWAWDLIYYWAS